MRHRLQWNALAAVERELRDALDRGEMQAAERAVPQLKRLLKKLPQVVETCRGQDLLSMAAAANQDWRAAASHRRLEIAHMAFMRELAQTEAPLAKRTILRDFSSRRMAEAYRQLTRAYSLAGAAVEARVARRHASRWERIER
jgi:hypothetical protein